jgi:hypothetical protein
MGKTVESYKMALESEIKRWNGFAVVLGKLDREAFEAGNVFNAIVFEPGKMSIILGEQKKIGEFEKRLLQ